MGNDLVNFVLTKMKIKSLILMLLVIPYGGFLMPSFGQTPTDNRRIINLFNTENQESNAPNLLPQTKRSFLSGNTVNPFQPQSNQITTVNNWNMTGGENFIDPGEKYLRKLNTAHNSNANEDKSLMSRVDVFLGDIRDNGDFVQIALRDHEYPDGDLIRVYVNDIEVFPRVLLHERYSILQVQLAPGFNKLDFLALNQGSSGPNTAEIKVFNDHGNLVGNDRWYMATGVKATYLVVKE